eukprot:6204782-Pleurochrysis_carterae.AAC.2
MHYSSTLFQQVLANTPSGDIGTGTCITLRCAGIMCLIQSLSTRVGQELQLAAPTNRPAPCIVCQMLMHPLCELSSTTAAAQQAEYRCEHSNSQVPHRLQQAHPVGHVEAAEESEAHAASWKWLLQYTMKIVRAMVRPKARAWVRASATAMAMATATATATATTTAAAAAAVRAMGTVRAVSGCAGAVGCMRSRSAVWTQHPN